MRLLPIERENPEAGGFNLNKILSYLNLNQKNLLSILAYGHDLNLFGRLVLFTNLRWYC